MCGRFSQALPAELLVNLFGATDVRPWKPEPSWNVAPSQSVTVVGRDAERDRRVLTLMHWGLLAPWEKVPELAKVRPINARCETIASSELFRRAFQQRRCLVPADCWFEWQRVSGQKLPHALAWADRQPVVLGGVWECWRGPVGDRALTLAIVTTPATEELVSIHDRMPLVLEPEAWPLWLGEEEGDVEGLMRPAEPGRIVSWRVGRAVGSPRNNGPELLAVAA